MATYQPQKHCSRFTKKVRKILAPLYDSGLLISRQWDISHTPSLTRKTAVITGGSSGIGTEIVRQFLSHGIERVIVLGRSATRFAYTHDTVLCGDGRVKFMECDLSNLRSVESVGRILAQSLIRLDILILNAGMCPDSDYTVSAQGVDSMFATNHLGHFHLANLLLPVLVKTGDARVVIHTSVAHRRVRKIDYNSLMSNERLSPSVCMRSDILERYKRSKLANVLHTVELARRLQEKGVNRVLVNCAWPGFTDSQMTDGWRRTLGLTGRIFGGLVKMFGISKEQAASTAMFLATSSEVDGITGGYWTPIGRQATMNPLALDEKEARKLWDWSESIIYSSVGQQNDYGLDGISMPGRFGAYGSYGQ